MGEAYLDIIVRIERAEASLKQVQQGMQKLQQKSEQANQVMRNQFEATGKIVNKLSNYLAGIFSIGAIVSFTKQMIAQRSEWEKQVAILKTVTGSYKEAESTMRLLDKLERETIVPLKEISDAYIRLVNKGIKPTYDQMKKMIDLAVSQNRTFGQLAEAIFDASQGATKSLRDLGIQSKIEGNKIQLTYKNITETVDFTAQAITDFTIKVGGSQGVMGASAEVAKTLSGQLFILKDSWEDLLRVMGEQSEGVFINAIKWITDIIDTIALMANPTSPLEHATIAFEKFIETIKGLGKEAKAAEIVKYINDLNLKIDNVGKSIIEVGSKIKSPWLLFSNAAILANDALIDEEKFLTKLQSSYRVLIPMLTEYLNSVWAGTDAIADGDDEIKKYITTLKTLRDKLALLKSEYEDINILDKEALKIKATKILGVEQEIKILEDLIKLEDKEKKNAERAAELEKELNRQEQIYKEFYNWLKSEVDDTWKDIKDIESSHWRAANYIIEKMYLEREINLKEYLENKRQIEIEQAKIAGVDEIKTQEEINAQIDLINADYDKKQKDRKIEIAGEVLRASVAFLDTYSQYQNAKMDAELARAEGNEKKQEEIRKKYARKEQTISIARAIISGAEGIVKTGANLGYPLAIPFQVLQAIAIAMQIATIKAQKFATGVLDLQGRGTGTSDSIPSMLSRHETVMTAKETKEFYPYLKAMKEGKFPKLQMELMNDFSKMNQINNLNYDNSKEIRELRNVQKLLKDLQSSEHIEGKYKVVRRGNTITKISLN